LIAKTWDASVANSCGGWNSTEFLAVRPRRRRLRARVIADPLIRVSCAALMFRRCVADPYCGADQLRRWRCGRIVMRNGQLLRIERRFALGNVSVARVWWEGRLSRADDSMLWLDYRQPVGMPAFLTLDYVRGGRRAGYRSLIGASRVLDEIARLRKVQAIVTHVCSASISDRFLQRLGWRRHLQHWSGRHWIRRFYDGYPEAPIDRYLSGPAVREPAAESVRTACALPHEFSKPRDPVS